MKTSHFSVLGFTSLPRYPLSCVLSYLTECDGTSTLITNKTWSRHVLPLFSLRRSLLQTTGRSDGGDNVRKIPQTRHLFRLVPVQDAETLMARLNSRRLFKRLVHVHRKRRDTTSADTDRTIGPVIESAYDLGLTTEELARLEWHDARNNSHAHHIWSADMGLLMWRDGFLPALPAGIAQNPIPFPSATSTIVLASYPRSGNSLLRTLLERTTLCVTGSDTRPDRTLSRALALQHNLVGEGIVRPKSIDEFLTRPSVGIVKTHWPERRGCLPYKANRVILLIRNPFDSIDSYWNLCVTNTHTKTVAESIYQQYAEKFHGLALSEMNTWIRFHAWWLRRGLDICVVRYEDLVLDIGATFREIMKFVLEVGQLPPFWEGRIRHALNEGADVTSTSTNSNTAGLGSYQPRSDGNVEVPDESATKSTSPSIGKSLRRGRYTDEMLHQMHGAAAASIGKDGEGMSISLLERFGYDVFEQGFPATKQSFSGVYVERGTSTIKVNVGQEIRAPDDPYGRAMTNWRKGETANDTEPFPTVPR